jgi:hypothetical protein
MRRIIYRGERRGGKRKRENAEAELTAEAVSPVGGPVVFSGYLVREMAAVRRWRRVVFSSSVSGGQ